MKVLILAGNSKHNKPWAFELKKYLEKTYDEVYVHEYKHWKTGDEFIDLDFELEALKELTNNWSNCIVVAKSIGTLLTLKTIDKKTFNPKQIVFLGVPLNLLGDDYSWFWKLLGKNSGNITIAQNDRDPLGSFDDLKNKLSEEEIKVNTFSCLSGDSHDYQDLEKIKTLTTT